MFKLCEPVTELEHGYIRNIKGNERRIEFMNRRIIEATLAAIREVISVNELVQFRSGITFIR